MFVGELPNACKTANMSSLLNKLLIEFIERLSGKQSLACFWKLVVDSRMIGNAGLSALLDGYMLSCLLREVTVSLRPLELNALQCPVTGSVEIGCS
jgi:hypothetical protein